MPPYLALEEVSLTTPACPYDGLVTPEGMVHMRCLSKKWYSTTRMTIKVIVRGLSEHGGW